VGAVVVKNLGAGTAGAGVGHHPEVVALVAAAFVVANADDAVLLNDGSADFLTKMVQMS
jgi:hypothetical protein